MLIICKYGRYWVCKYGRAGCGGRGGGAALSGSERDRE